MRRIICLCACVRWVYVSEWGCVGMCVHVGGVCVSVCVCGEWGHVAPQSLCGGVSAPTAAGALFKCLWSSDINEEVTYGPYLTPGVMTVILNLYYLWTACHWWSVPAQTRSKLSCMFQLQLSPRRVHGLNLRKTFKFKCTYQKFTAHGCKASKHR